ncbi:MAG: hypothetical protein JW986_04930 [Methanotrichaceae archaeon]|nr:hypothetical protein [Methanotrichaceae archaeon]
MAAILLFAHPAAAWPNHTDAPNMEWGDDLLQSVTEKLPSADAADAFTPSIARADGSSEADDGPAALEGGIHLAPETLGFCAALCDQALCENMTLCELCNWLSSNNSSINASKLDGSIALLCRELLNESTLNEGEDGGIYCDGSCDLGQYPLKAFCNESFCIEALANASLMESSLDDGALDGAKNGTLDGTLDGDAFSALVGASQEDDQGLGVELDGGFQGYWGMTASKKGFGKSGINSHTMLQGSFDLEKSVYFHE